VKNTLFKQSLTSLKARKINRTILLSAGFLAISCVAASAQQRLVCRLARRHNDYQW
jgi:hypothetical protein